MRIHAPMAPEAPERDLANQAASADRLVIRNADLTIVVADVPARVTAIQNMANAMGGFVVSSNIYETYINNGEKVPQAQVVVRVPSQRLDEALTQIKANTVEVQSESQSGQDVTDQHVDLNSRLTAKLAAEEQLLEIMQEARQTEDVLALLRSCSRSERHRGIARSDQYLEQSAPFSAISVNIIAEETIKPLEVAG
jgi:hypothetical protein